MWVKVGKCGECGEIWVNVGEIWVKVVIFAGKCGETAGKCGDMRVNVVNEVMDVEESCINLTTPPPHPPN